MLSRIGARSVPARAQWARVMNGAQNYWELLRPATAPAMVAGNTFGNPTELAIPLASIGRGRGVALRMAFIHGRPIADPTLDLRFYVRISPSAFGVADNSVFSNFFAASPATENERLWAVKRVLFTTGDQMSALDPAAANADWDLAGKRITWVTMDELSGDALHGVVSANDLVRFGPFVLNANYAAFISEKIRLFIWSRSLD